MVNQIDFLASFAKLIGADLKDKQGIDSRDNLAALLGKDELGTTIMLEESGSPAIREGNWKYIPARAKKRNQRGGRLFNLEADPSEQENIIAKHPERAKKLQNLLEKLTKSKQGVRAELTR